MRLDEVTAQIRPRSDWEAVDLGFAMVRRDFWRCMTLWWLTMALPALIAGALLFNHPLWIVAVIWWLKPMGSRMVLFQLSRRLFGEQSTWKSLLVEIPKAWVRRFGYRFLWARFSPWLPVTMAVEDLEGLRGKSYRIRSAQVVRRGEGAVMWIYIIGDLSAIWLGVAVAGLMMMLAPDGWGAPWKEALEGWNPEQMMDFPLLISWSAAGCVLVGMCLADLFVTGAGFGIYLNNRTWVEGWDVDLALRRLAERLGTLAVMMMCLLGGISQAGAAPLDRIDRIKADPVFEVHTVKDRVRIDPPSRPPWIPLELLSIIMNVIVIVAVVAAIGLVAWLIWKYRHLVGVPKLKLEPKVRPAARVVMGLDVSRDTLPDNIPTAAWKLWQESRHQEALALLYRGSISRVMEDGRLEIQESDTEGDCLSRVEKAGNANHPDFFRSITVVWSRLAYAGIHPADLEVKGLCDQWPFDGRRGP